MGQHETEIRHDHGETMLVIAQPLVLLSHGPTDTCMSSTNFNEEAYQKRRSTNGVLPDG